MDHGFRRPSQPWEESDGSVYLLRQARGEQRARVRLRGGLAQAAALAIWQLAALYPKWAEAQLPALFELAGYRHFVLHTQLLETIWKQARARRAAAAAGWTRAQPANPPRALQFPAIVAAIDKKALKRHLNAFLPHLAYSLACGVSLTEHAAAEALQQLETAVGPSILRGRAEECGSDVVQAFERAHHMSTEAEWWRPAVTSGRDTPPRRP